MTLYDKLKIEKYKLELLEILNNPTYLYEIYNDLNKVSKKQKQIINEITKINEYQASGQTNQSDKLLSEFETNRRDGGIYFVVY